MLVLVTGAKGFVGRWLTAELEAAGHEVVGTDMELDVRDGAAVAEFIGKVQPQAIAHLAAVAFSPDATADPNTAFAINVGGTVNILEGARRLAARPVVFVPGSSEVYGVPQPADLPLNESTTLRPTRTYALSKAAQESIAVSYGLRFGMPTVVSRSFNHIGPGQRDDFVVSALAKRVAALARGEIDHIPVGNVDVRRDLSDVRDVVRAYRLLIERAAASKSDPVVVNVCSGESVTIRWVAETLCSLAGVEPKLWTDPSLVRDGDPPEIRGDHALLSELTGWQPTFALSDTLREVWSSL